MNVTSVCQDNLSTGNTNDVRYIVISYENAENPDQNIEYIQEFEDNKACIKNQHTQQYASDDCSEKIERIEEDQKDETYEYIQCIICDQSFSNKWLLVDHIRNHPKVYTFVHDCILCNKKFRYLPSLQNHLRKHTGEKAIEKPYICILCSKKFGTPEYLIKHMQKHEEYNSSLTCQFCDITFDKFEHLQGHILSHVSSDQPFHCNQCPKMFVLPEYLKKHLQRHKNEKTFHCNICNVSFDDFLSLKNHKKTHLSLYVKQFQCYTCNSTFKRAKELKAHLITKNCRNRVNHTNGSPLVDKHTKKTEIKVNEYLSNAEQELETVENNDKLAEEFKVEYLYDEQDNNVTYTTEGNSAVSASLEDPLALDNSNVNNNTLQQMNPELVTYSTDYQLQLYGPSEKSVTNNPQTVGNNNDTNTENRGVINKTEKRSAFQPTILNVTIIKPEDSNYNTTQINNSVDVKIEEGEEINTDNIIITDGAYLYPCIFCSKIFDQIKILKQHEQTHTGDKPYQCIICNTKYSNHENLKIHEKCHQYLNYYQCYLCDKKFIDPKLLKTHFETHKTIKSLNNQAILKINESEEHGVEQTLQKTNKNNLTRNHVEKITPMKHLTIDKNFQCAFMQFLNSNSKRK